MLSTNLQLNKLLFYLWPRNVIVEPAFLNQLDQPLVLLNRPFRARQILFVALYIPKIRVGLKYI